MKGIDCPTCERKISKSEISPSRTAVQLLQSLSISCAKSCGAKFQTHNLNEKENHENGCNGPEESFKLTDILEMPKSESIPRAFEKLAVHVIKTKMAHSTAPDKEISFPTGGSRVS